MSRSQNPRKQTTKDDENKVKLFLTNQSLNVIRFLKSELVKKKTPDFKVQSCLSGELLFYCEVKSVEPGAVGKDPTFNRLTKDISEAVKQFDAVNPGLAFPNVLAFVNHDSACGFLDLIAVLTGNAMTEGSAAIPIYRLYSEGRIKDKKSRINLFIWLDDFLPHRLLFSQTNENHHNLLCSCFNINQSTIKIIDS
jgi:hypothetical protein